MFLNSSDCEYLAKHNSLRGMGFWWVPIAAQGMQMLSDAEKDDAQSGAKSPSGGGPSIMTATTVQTTVSPQISPIFIQQDEPSGSPVNAGVSMAPGGIPQTGMIPGIDAARPAWMESYSMPEINKPLLFGSLALLGAAIVWKVMQSRRRKT